MGTVWMEASGMTDEKVKGGNMPLIFGLSFVFSLMLAFGVYYLVVHQTHVFSLLMNLKEEFDSFMGGHAADHRTFKHGAFHGTLDALLVVFPVLATNSLFERKGFKYIGVNTGYWVIILALMGGIVCQWA